MTIVQKRGSAFLSTPSTEQRITSLAIITVVFLWVFPMTGRQSQGLFIIPMWRNSIRQYEDKNSVGSDPLKNLLNHDIVLKNNVIYDTIV